MKTMVKLSDTEIFNADELDTKEVQLMLRNQYVVRGRNIAICLCNNEVKLKLVIAYRRASGKFELRKYPAEDYRLHNKLCKFHKVPEFNTTSHTKSFTVSTPCGKGFVIPDHENLRSLLLFLWAELETRCGLFSRKKIYWNELQVNLYDLSDKVTVNAQPLGNKIVILNPAKMNNLVPIDIEPHNYRFLLGELFSVSQANGKNFGIKLKGSDETIWLNEKWLFGLKESQKKLLTRFDYRTDKTIVLLVCLRSSSGKSIQAFSIAMISISPSNFCRE